MGRISASEKDLPVTRLSKPLLKQFDLASAKREKIIIIDFLKTRVLSEYCNLKQKLSTNLLFILTSEIEIFFIKI